MKNLILCCLFLLCTATTFAQAWNGGTGRWDNPANWDSGTIPNATDDVSIPSGTVTIPTGYNALAQSVDVTGGLIIQGNAFLIIDGGQDGMTINTGGTVENVGSIDIDNTALNGIYIDGGVFSNYAAGVIQIDNTTQDGIHVANTGGLFSNTNLITMGSNIGQDGIQVDNYAIFDNTASGEITIDNTVDHGVYLSPNGAFSNSGILRLHNGITGSGLHLENATFDNNACGTLLTDPRLTSLAGTFNNYGWIRSRYAGTHTISFDNYGVIEDNPSAFAPTNNGVIINRINGTHCAGGTVPNALNLGSLVNFSITNNEWYVDENLTVSAGSYDPSTNKFHPLVSAAGLDVFYVEFTDNLNGCAIIMKVFFVNPLQSLQYYYADLDGDGFR